MENKGVLLVRFSLYFPFSQLVFRYSNILWASYLTQIMPETFFSNVRNFLEGFAFSFPHKFLDHFFTTNFDGSTRNKLIFHIPASIIQLNRKNKNKIKTK